MEKSKQENVPAGRKQPYRRPTIKVIELATDEVLGTGCKTDSDVAPSAICGDSPCGSQIGS